MAEKQKAEYYKQGEFLFRIGKVAYTRAHKPLPVHNHGNCAEFVFMIKGCQHYQVEGAEYEVHGGEVFMTRPGEVHGTGNKPEDKAFFYYLIADPERLAQQEYGCVQGEKESYLAVFKTGRRIQKAKSWYGEVCERLLGLCQNRDLLRDTKIRSLLSVLLLDIGTGVQTQPEVCGEENKMKLVQEYIHSHIREDLALEKLAVLSGLSLSGFKTAFCTQTGIPPREYIIRQKLQQCRGELQKTSKTITEISFEYGFSSSQYFSTVFKQYCCMSPSQFRTLYQSEQARKGEEFIYDKS